jgi:hypothetical protein
MLGSDTPRTPRADAEITADRDETKYLIAQEQRSVLVRALDRHLPQHRFRGEGQNLLPSPQHFVSTVYFDTPSCLHFRAAQESADDHVKVRVKEYYDVHPSLAELATNLDEVLHRPPWVWLELKRRRGTRTSKHRVRVERRLVPEWLAGADGPASGEADLVRSYVSALSEPLLPFGVVNYRRSSWQNETGGLRVTLDSELAFYEAPQDLWQKPALVRSALGAPRFREYRLLLEIKQREPLPAWLEVALVSVRARPVKYSKFVRALEALVIDG